MISTKSFEAKGEQETKSTVSEAWAGDLAQTAAPHWVLSKLSRGYWRSRRSGEAWECVWLCLSEAGQSSGWAGSRQGSEERGERRGSEAVLRCLIQVTRRKSEPVMQVRLLEMAALKCISGPLPCSTKTDGGWQAGSASASILRRRISTQKSFPRPQRRLRIA